MFAVHCECLATRKTPCFTSKPKFMWTVDTGESYIEFPIQRPPRTHIQCTCEQHMYPIFNILLFIRSLFMFFSLNSHEKKTGWSCFFFMCVCLHIWIVWCTMRKGRITIQLYCHFKTLLKLLLLLFASIKNGHYQKLIISITAFSKINSKRIRIKTFSCRKFMIKWTIWLEKIDESSIRQLWLFHYILVIHASIPKWAIAGSPLGYWSMVNYSNANNVDICKFNTINIEKFIGFFRC